MVDIEARVISTVAEAVKAAYPGATVSGEYVPAPSKFPHVYIRETDNSSHVRSYRVDGGEANAQIVFTVDVFSNKQTGKKSECRAITALIDDVLQKFCFQRTFCSPYPNESNASVYRVVSRYRKLESAS